MTQPKAYSNRERERESEGGRERLTQPKAYSNREREREREGERGRERENDAA